MGNCSFYFFGAPEDLASPEEQFQDIVNSFKGDLKMVFGTLIDSYNFYGKLPENTKNDLLEYVELSYGEIKACFSDAILEVKYNRPEQVRAYNELRKFMENSIKIFK